MQRKGPNVMARGFRKQKKQLEIVDGRSRDDSVRVWDRYRDMAFFWRTVALLQVPLCIGLLIAMISMYFSADTIVEVPERPQPGHYSVRKLPDSEFINVATEVSNLVTTFTPATADRQFKAARKYLWEPALTQFEQDKIATELRMIQETSRSQLFFIDIKQIKVERDPRRDVVVVTLPGTRQKLIGNRALDPDEMVVLVQLTTIPKNIYNEFGIVVTDIRFRSSDMTTVGAPTAVETAPTPEVTAPTAVETAPVAPTTVPSLQPEIAPSEPALPIDEQIQ